MGNFWKGFAAMYLLTAVMGGLAMGRVVPALNQIGMLYAGATWPVAVFCVAADLPCTNVPPQRYAKWFFTFPESPNAE